MNSKEDYVRRIMILSHEMGREMGREEVFRGAKKLACYLREKEHVKDANLDYALYYWQEILENKYYG